MLKRYKLFLFILFLLSGFESETHNVFASHSTGFSIRKNDHRTYSDSNLGPPQESQTKKAQPVLPNLGKCEICDAESRSPIVTLDGCGHVSVCSDCIKKSTEESELGKRCPFCRGSYDQTHVAVLSSTPSCIPKHRRAYSDGAQFSKEKLEQNAQPVPVNLGECVNCHSAEKSPLVTLDQCGHVAVCAVCIQKREALGQKECPVCQQKYGSARIAHPSDRPFRDAVEMTVISQAIENTIRRTQEVLPPPDAMEASFPQTGFPYFAPWGVWELRNSPPIPPIRNRQNPRRTPPQFREDFSSGSEDEGETPSRFSEFAVRRRSLESRR